MHILKGHLFPVSLSSLILGPSCFSPLSTLLFPLLSMSLCLFVAPLALTPDVQVTMLTRFIGATFCYLGASDLDTRIKRSTGFIQVSAMGQLGNVTLEAIIQLLSKVIMGALCQLTNV